MQKNLVIVESPAKAKTIEKFLGKDYRVLSSYGHIRDLKKKAFSIDVENNFTPVYEIPAEKKELVSQLKKAAEKVEMVWLASDEDREGEAIAWHLSEVLNLAPEKTKRIVFHEITQTAILRAIEQPREIDINLVGAQQARRALDRIVGFELSPVLWRKVKPSLSAGRVQSVAVRLIVEREREVQAFKSESYFRVSAMFLVPDEDGMMAELKADLNTRFSSREDALAFLEYCKETQFTIEEVTCKPLKKYPAPPFTTSTLQQEAARKLGFSVAQTMNVAQKLYESGRITYMRTDSVNLSTLAIDACKEEITNLMGEKYHHSRQFETKTKGAQEAHEAIRPTYMDQQVIDAPSAEKKLYSLIWKRTLASQMMEADIEKTTVAISVQNKTEKFVAVGEVIKFDGFLRLYKESYDEDQEQEDLSGMLPPLSKQQVLKYKTISAMQRYTQHVPRYTEASLVHKLEELGIGRPSTYAPTISTIQQRDYVVRGDRPGVERKLQSLILEGCILQEEERTEIAGQEKGKLVPTDIGSVVNDFLMQFFPTVLDYNFTATVEREFDEVAEGQKPWVEILRKFYDGFHPLVVSTMEAKMEHKVGERELGIDPKSGKPVFVKIGRFGPVVQIGEASDEDKPKFAQLGAGLSIETITLEQALELFRLPRTLGNYEEEEIAIGSGRFGPYIRHKAKFVSIPKGEDPLTMTLEDAVALIEAKREVERKNHLKAFAEEPELEIMNGRFGPYIAYKGVNYKIPKGIVPEDLNLDACHELIRLQDEKTASNVAAGKAPRARKTKK
ncbi:MAG: type I DNA topoisomerase [Bacteroidaceae bacterium]|nr:type I DNA topoisomerase [Bacteroidaceae bacterium]MBP9637211.1 type I DNA topoisomerase [Bacteroidaceae bacterium]